MRDAGHPDPGTRPARIDDTMKRRDPPPLPLGDRPGARWRPGRRGSAASRARAVGTGRPVRVPAGGGGSRAAEATFVVVDGGHWAIFEHPDETRTAPPGALGTDCPDAHPLGRRSRYPRCSDGAATATASVGNPRRGVSGGGLADRVPRRQPDQRRRQQGQEDLGRAESAQHVHRRLPLVTLPTLPPTTPGTTPVVASSTAAHRYHPRHRHRRADVAPTDDGDDGDDGYRPHPRPIHPTAAESSRRCSKRRCSAAKSRHRPTRRRRVSASRTSPTTRRAGVVDLGRHALRRGAVYAARRGDDGVVRACIEGLPDRIGDERCPGDQCSRTRRRPTRRGSARLRRATPSTRSTSHRSTRSRSSSSPTTPTSTPPRAAPVDHDRPPHTTTTAT